MTTATTKYFLAFALLLIITQLSVAATKTWDGGGGDLDWSTGNNWAPNGVPADDDDITIDCSCTVTANGDLVIDGSLTIASGTTLDLDGNKIEFGKNDNTATFLNNGTIQNSSDFKIKGDGLVGAGPFGTNYGTIDVTKMHIGNNDGGGKVTNESTGTINLTSTADNSMHLDGTICNKGIVDLAGGLQSHGGIVECGGIFNAALFDLGAGKGAEGGASGGPTVIDSQSLSDGSGCSGANSSSPVYVIDGGNTEYTYQELLDDFGLTDTDNFDLDANGVTSCGQAPLPVELLYFSAKVEEEHQVKIEWATATETNNDYFVVERSTSGTDWEEVAMIGGAGNSTETLYYTEADTYPHSGISYYQLKQVDYDGTQSYSEIVPVSIKYRTSLRLSPNPTTGSFVIEGEDVENSEITMTNMLGQKANISIITNTNEALIQTSVLKKGAYLVAINRNGIKDVRKVLIR